jgi:hypothetical protein
MIRNPAKARAIAGLESARLSALTVSGGVADEVMKGIAGLAGVCARIRKPTTVCGR